MTLQWPRMIASHRAASAFVRDSTYSPSAARICSHRSRWRKAASPTPTACFNTISDSHASAPLCSFVLSSRANRFRKQSRCGGRRVNPQRCQKSTGQSCNHSTNSSKPAPPESRPLTTAASMADNGRRRPLRPRGSGTSANLVRKFPPQALDITSPRQAPDSERKIHTRFPSISQTNQNDGPGDEDPNALDTVSIFFGSSVRS